MFRTTGYHNEREGDHDSSQELVGYGVFFQGVSDGVIVAEEAPFEGAVSRGEDEKWQPDCQGEARGRSLES